MKNLLPNEKINLTISIEDAALRSLVIEKLSAAGFDLCRREYEEIFSLEPYFGQHQEAVFVANMGEDRERVHTLAQHLYDTWSEKGFVLYIIFYSSPPSDAEMFRIWALDAGWRYNSPQMFWTLSRPSGEGIEKDVDELIHFIPHMTSWSSEIDGKD